MAAVVEPEAELLDGAGRDGHQPLLRPLAHDADEAFVQKEICQTQRHQFRDTQSAREEHLDDGAVAVALPLRQVDGLLQQVHLGGREHLGQVLAQDGRLQQLRRVVVAVAVDHQEVEERAHAAQDAALRARADAYVVESGGEGLQVLKCDVEHVLVFQPEEDEQFLQVALVGLQRVGRHVALQLQVAHVTAHDVFAVFCHVVLSVEC